jgi:phosphoglycolate phosphatase
MSKMIKTIIFDYDGVIVDSFPTIYNIYYKAICPKLNKKCPDTIEGFKKLYYDTFVKLYADLDIKGEEKELAENIYRAEIKKQKPVLFKGIKEAIIKLSERYNLIILSSNYEFEITQKLVEHGLDEYFSKIIAKKEFAVKSFRKTQPIINFIEQNNLKKEEVIMIGDRDKDYFSAEKAKIKSIIVEYGWGHTNKIPEPNPKIEKPLDLLKAIELANN